MRAKCLPQECSTVAGSGLGTGESCMLIARLPCSPLVFNFYTDYEPQKTCWSFRPYIRVTCESFLCAVSITNIDIILCYTERNCLALSINLTKIRSDCLRVGQRKNLVVIVIVSACPNGKPFLLCLHMCQFARCPAYPKATCFSDPCKMCKVEFHDEQGNIVNCTKGLFCVNSQSCVKGKCYLFFHTCLTCIPSKSVTYINSRTILNLSELTFFFGIINL